MQILLTLFFLLLFSLVTTCVSNLREYKEFYKIFHCSHVSKTNRKNHVLEPKKHRIVTSICNIHCACKLGYVFTGARRELPVPAVGAERWWTFVLSGDIPNRWAGAAVLVRGRAAADGAHHADCHHEQRPQRLPRIRYLRQRWQGGRWDKLLHITWILRP